MPMTPVLSCASIPSAWVVTYAVGAPRVHTTARPAVVCFVHQTCQWIHSTPTPPRYTAPDPPEPCNPSLCTRRCLAWLMAHAQSHLRKLTPFLMSVRVLVVVVQYWLSVILIPCAPPPPPPPTDPQPTALDACQR